MIHNPTSLHATVPETFRNLLLFFKEKTLLSSLPECCQNRRWMTLRIYFHQFTLQLRTYLAVSGICLLDKFRLCFFLLTTAGLASRVLKETIILISFLFSGLSVLSVDLPLTDNPNQPSFSSLTEKCSEAILDSAQDLPAVSSELF